MANYSLRGAMEQAVDGLGLELRTRRRDSIARRRRRRGLGARREGTLQMVEKDGLVVVRESQLPGLGGRRRARRDAAGDVVDEIPFERLKGSQIKDALERLDAKLTGRFGFRRLRVGSDGKADLSQPVRVAPKTGRVLLLVHGTFSNAENIVGQLEAHDHGRDFLSGFVAGYDQAIVFNHRTLGISPMLNARELYRLFRGSEAHVDVICHSRGGLVTRCWLESMDAVDPKLRRVVFVASPLAGTSLASPPKLRATLNLLANIGNALGKVTGSASAAVPFLAVTSTLFQVFSSLTTLVARTPVIDAAVAMVPGLDAMSRVGNNRLIQTFREDALDPAGRYFVVSSNFQPKHEGWKFWRYFRKLGTRAANLFVDPIFDGPNDLVVDSAAMADLKSPLGRDVPSGQICDYPESDVVHHTNYFEQKRVLDFIRGSLA